MGQDTWYAAVALQYVFATVAMQLAVVFALWWYLRREDRYLIHFAVWCVAAVLLLVVNGTLFSSPPSAWVEPLLSVRNVGFGAIAVLLVPPLAALAGRRTPWVFLGALTTFYVVRFVVWETTELLYRHLDTEGYPVYGPLRLPFVIVPVVLLLGIAAYYVRLVPEPVPRRAIGVAMVAMALIAVMSATVSSSRGRELLSAGWTLPVIAVLGIIGLQRLAAQEQHRRRLLARQSALAMLGNLALRPDAAGGGRSVAEEARHLLERELTRPVRLEGAGGDDAGHGAAELTVVGAHSSWTARLPEEVPKLTEEDRDFTMATLQVVSWAIEREEAEAELRRSALEDPLTGLPNRMLLLDRLQTALERSRRTNVAVAVLFCDLDGFKRVNDALGHAAGDELLKRVAAALAAVARASDTVSRFGGDEFVVVGPDVPDLAAAAQLAERVRAAVAEVREPDTGRPVRMSVGVALGRGGDTAPALLAEADLGMYRAKQRGRSRKRRGRAARGVDPT